MYHVVLCTCPDEEIAATLANTLVNEKLAACVNIMPKMISVYLWQGEVESASEVQLLIKTTSELFSKLADRIKQLHPYDVPEIVALNIQQGSNEYLNWITESLK